MRYSLTQLKSLVYASSSWVYGARTKQPFSIEEPADHRVSIYAPTKRDDIVPAIVTAAETANPRAQRASLYNLGNNHLEALLVCVELRRDDPTLKQPRP